MFSTSPEDLFRYQRNGFDPDIDYDESLSDESGVDANTAMKATPGNGKPTQSSQMKDPVGKQVNGTIETGIVAMAPKVSKPTGVGKVSRTSPSATSSTSPSEPEVPRRKQQLPSLRRQALG